MFSRDRGASPDDAPYCEGEYHMEHFEMKRRGQNCYGGFCSVDCREDFFSSIGAGDVREVREWGSQTLIIWEEIRYIRTLPSPA